VVVGIAMTPVRAPSPLVVAIRPLNSRRSPLPPKRHYRHPWRARHSTAVETSNPGGSKVPEASRTTPFSRQAAEAVSEHTIHPEGWIPRCRSFTRRGATGLATMHLFSAAPVRSRHQRNPKVSCRIARYKPCRLGRQPARCVTIHPQGTIAIRLSSLARRGRIHSADVQSRDQTTRTWRR